MAKPGNTSKLNFCNSNLIELVNKLSDRYFIYFLLIGKCDQYILRTI